MGVIVDFVASNFCVICSLHIVLKIQNNYLHAICIQNELNYLLSGNLSMGIFELVVK